MYTIRSANKITTFPFLLAFLSYFDSNRINQIINIIKQIIIEFISITPNILPFLNVYDPAKTFL